MGRLLAAVPSAPWASFGPVPEGLGPPPSQGGTGLALVVPGKTPRTAAHCAP